MLQVYDALSGLNRLSITVDILKKTKIGLTVNNIKKKYVSQKWTHDLARDLVNKWKKVCDSHQKCMAASYARSSPAPSVLFPVVPAVPAPAPAVPTPAAAAGTASIATAKPAEKKDLGYLLADLSEPRKNVSLAVMLRLLLVFNVMRWP